VKKIKLALMALVLTLGLWFASATPAGALNLWVKNGNCRHSGISILLRDSSGHRWTVRPGQAVNMRWSGRQVWVPSHAYLWKDGCRGAWDLAYSQGFWRSFGYRWLPVEFSAARY
jgi:hypothetical protein